VISVGVGLDQEELLTKLALSLWLGLHVFISIYWKSRIIELPTRVAWPDTGTRPDTETRNLVAGSGSLRSHQGAAKAAIRRNRGCQDNHGQDDGSQNDRMWPSHLSSARGGRESCTSIPATAAARMRRTQSESRDDVLRFSSVMKRAAVMDSSELRHLQELRRRRFFHPSKSLVALLNVIPRY
jgi:hypothetical protein